MIKDKDMASTFIRMGLIIKEIGQMIDSMALAKKNGRMAQHTLVTILTV